MLEQLDQVAWGRIHHAYGTCEHLPAAIRRLASDKKSERESALDWLREGIFHQETHYEATAAAFPFLLEVAAIPAVADRDRIWDFLRDLFVQSASFVLEPPPSPRQAAAAEERGRRYGLSSLVSSEHWRENRRTTEAVAWQCWERLLQVVVTDPLPAVRCEASAVLTHLVREAPQAAASSLAVNPTAEILRQLRDRVRREGDAAVRVCLTFGLGNYRDQPGALPYLQETYREAADEPGRVAAAAGLHLGPRPPAAEVTRCLIGGLVGDVLADERFRVVPWLRTRWHEDFADQSFRCLLHWLNSTPHEGLPISALLAESLEAGPRRQRARAVAVLGGLEVAPPGRAKMLQGLLADGDLMVRAEAVEALYRQDLDYPPDRLRAALREVLRRGDVESRRAAVKAVLAMQQVYCEREQRAIEEDPADQSGRMAVWAARQPPVLAALPLLPEAAEREEDTENQRLLTEAFDSAAWWALPSDDGCTEQGQKPPELRAAVGILCRWLAKPVLWGRICWTLYAIGGAHGGRPARGLDAAVPALLDVLTSRHPDCYRAALPLAGVHSQADVILPAMIRVLQTATEPQTRCKVAYAIRWLPNPSSALPAMLDAFFTGDPELMREVGHFLTEHCLRSPKAARALVRAFEQDRRTPDGRPLRLQLIELLPHLQVERPRTARALFRAACAGGDPAVRRSAARALAGGEFADTLRSPELAEALLQAFEEDRRAPDGRRLRPELTELLGRLRAERLRTARALFRAACADDDPAVRRGAAKALARGGFDASLVRRLSERLLRQRDSAASQGLAEGLAELGPRAAPLAPYLLHELEDAATDVGLAALDALLRIGVRGPEIASALLRLSRDAGAEVRRALIHIRFDSLEETLPYLLRALQDQDESVRSDALFRLEQNASPEVLVPVLAGLLQDRDPHLCLRACEDLERLGPRAAAAVPALAASLDDPSPSLRLGKAQAPWAIDRRQKDHVVSVLRELLKQEGKPIRDRAQELLDKVEAEG